jgi:phenylacetate-CoA ligase
MHAWLARRLYYTAQSLRGEPVGSVVRELRASERWPLERLRAQQWERVRALVRHAWDTVPWYRRSWSAAGFQPGDLKTWQDWERLPALAKPEIRQQAGQLLSSAPGKGLKATTSGSSGTPVAVVRSHASWGHAHANVIRGWGWHGIDVGDPYAYFWGLALDKSGRRQAGLRDAFFNRQRLSAFEITPARARGFYDQLRRSPAAWGFGYPSAITSFADEVLAQGLDGRALKWKAAVTTAECLRPHQRERLQEAFGCNVVDSYGCAEIGVTGFGCEAGGMHVPIESVVVDTVPAEDGRLEVLLTDLFNFSQPVIRYRIGDMVEAAPEGACACGRTLPRLGAIQGRAGDFITLPDGRVINGLLPYYIFRHHAKSGKVREYQFVEFPGGRIELRVLPGPEWTDAARAEIEAEVSRGLGLPIALTIVDHIARIGRGKHRDFVKAADTGEA